MMTNNLAPRISGWITSYGLDYTVKRVRRNMVFYRRIYLNDIELLDKDKPSVLQSYLELKEFLRTKEVSYEPEKSEAYKRLSQRDFGSDEGASDVQTDEEESKEDVQGDSEE